MFVLIEADTGYSDETMRFGTEAEAHEFLDVNPETVYNLRIED